MPIVFPSGGFYFSFNRNTAYPGYYSLNCIAATITFPFATCFFALWDLLLIILNLMLLDLSSFLLLCFFFHFFKKSWCYKDTIFSPKFFKILLITFKSSSYLQLIFVCDLSTGPNSFCPTLLPVVPILLWHSPLFLHQDTMPSVSYQSSTYVRGSLFCTVHLLCHYQQPQLFQHSIALAAGRVSLLSMFFFRSIDCSQPFACPYIF